jgi:HSP20 family molecular chaperone IbpA/RNA polymerase subunit RPABC4/transcription elongation factor Spt4
MIFKKKVCRNCGEKINDEWDFCPRCGDALKEKETGKLDIFNSPFANIFGNMEKEFENTDKTPDFELPRFKLKPMKGSGITIVVHGGAGMGPVIKVMTNGNYKRFEPQIKRKLGVGPALEKMEEERVERKKFRKMPKITEEPKAEIKTAGANQIISIKLPGVKSENDVEVKKLEQSIEVKAFAGDKAYFKLIPIPSDAIVNKKFKDSLLTLEIGR